MKREKKYLQTMQGRNMVRPTYRKRNTGDSETFGDRQKIGVLS